MDALFRSQGEIEQALRRLYCVPTDNRDALVALGFQRIYPQVASGCDSHLWARSVASGYGSPLCNAGKFVIQRAFLEQKKYR